MLNFIIWHSRCKISKFACILPLFLVDEETDAVDQNGGHGSDPTHGNPGGCDIHQRRPILSCNILRIQLVKGADCEGGQRNADGHRSEERASGFHDSLQLLRVYHKGRAGLHAGILTGASAGSAAVYPEIGTGIRERGKRCFTHF